MVVLLGPYGFSRHLNSWKIRSTNLLGFSSSLLLILTVNFGHTTTIQSAPRIFQFQVPRRVSLTPISVWELHKPSQVPTELGSNCCGTILTGPDLEVCKGVAPPTVITISKVPNNCFWYKQIRASLHSGTNETLPLCIPACYFDTFDW